MGTENIKRTLDYLKEKIDSNEFSRVSYELQKVERIGAFSELNMTFQVKNGLQQLLGKLLSADGPSERAQICSLRICRRILSDRNLFAAPFRNEPAIRTGEFSSVQVVFLALFLVSIKYVTRTFEAD